MFTDFLVEKFTNFYLFIIRADAYLDLHLIYFFICSFYIIFCSFVLILVSNPIISVISLMIVYLFASFILICMEIHFLAVVFILIYLGAVIVLFLFIVMMLNIKVQNTLKFFNIVPILLLLCIFIFFAKNFDINFNFTFSLDYPIHYNYFSLLEFFSLLPYFDIFFNIEYIYLAMFYKENYILFSILLYMYFYIEILVACFILLLAMIGCISLGLVKGLRNMKGQESMEQLLHKNSFFKKIVTDITKVV
jgi:NADH:ubiquinone oxidoreductase subunit 6 (subunit J)